MRQPQYVARIRATSMTPEPLWRQFTRNDPRVLTHTQGQRIVFRNAYADLRPYSRGRVFLLAGQMTGTDATSRSPTRCSPASKAGCTEDGPTPPRQRGSGVTTA